MFWFWTEIWSRTKHFCTHCRKYKLRRERVNSAGWTIIILHDLESRRVQYGKLTHARDLDFHVYFIIFGENSQRYLTSGKSREKVDFRDPITKGLQWLRRGEHAFSSKYRQTTAWPWPCAQRNKRYSIECCVLVHKRTFTYSKNYYDMYIFNTL